MANLQILTIDAVGAKAGILMGYTIPYSLAHLGVPTLVRRLLITTKLTISQLAFSTFYLEPPSPDLLLPRRMQVTLFLSTESGSTLAFKGREVMWQREEGIGSCLREGFISTTDLRRSEGRGDASFGARIERHSSEIIVRHSLFVIN